MGGFLSCLEGNSRDDDHRSSESFCLLPTFLKKFGNKNTIRSTKTNRGSSSASNATYCCVRVEVDPTSRESASSKESEEVSAPAAPKIEEEEECAICLEVYDFENPKIFMQCMHYYHLSCAFEWMQRSATCPICSKELLFQELN